MSIKRISILRIAILLSLSILCVPSRTQSGNVFWIAYIGSPQVIDNAPCSGLCIVRSDGSESRSLAEVIPFFSPFGWSSDGEKIAFISDSGDLNYVDISNGIVTTLLTFDEILDFVPNGEYYRTLSVSVSSPIVSLDWNDENFLFLEVVVAVGYSASSHNIYQLNIADGEISQLATLPGHEIFRYSLESSYQQSLLLSQNSLCRFCAFFGKSLFLLNVITSDYALISEKENFLDTSPVWSMDGQYIYYFHWNNWDYESGKVIRVAVSDMEREVLVDNLSVPVRSATTFTDNNFYFIATINHCGSVYSVDLSTGDIVVFRDNRQPCFVFIAPAPEDRAVALAGCTGSTFGGCGIYIMQSDGSFRNVINRYAEILGIAWSPVAIED